MADLDELVRRGVISDDVAPRMVTHQAEKPNRAQPVIDPAKGYGGTALGFATGGLQGAGMPMPDWMRSNPVQRAVQNPDNAAAMGMANPTPVIAGNAARIARITEMLEAGHGTKVIAKDIGVGN